MVIGSGIVGAAAAHRLSGRGVPVTVVDGAYPGQATQAGGRDRVPVGGPSGRRGLVPADP
ncbi:FAD-dependent oxidoreductase [Nonomuraea ferruginea]